MEVTDHDASEANFLKELAADNQRKVDLIADHLEELSEQRRQDFHAYFFHLKSCKDIARARGVEEGTVRVNVGLAIKDMQKCLKDNGRPRY